MLAYYGLCSILTTIPIHAVLYLRSIIGLMLKISRICALFLMMRLHQVLISLLIACVGHDGYIVGQNFHRLFKLHCVRGMQHFGWLRLWEAPHNFPVLWWTLSCRWICYWWTNICLTILYLLYKGRCLYIWFFTSFCCTWLVIIIRFCVLLHNTFLHHLDSIFWWLFMHGHLTASILWRTALFWLFISLVSRSQFRHYIVDSLRVCFFWESLDRRQRGLFKVHLIIFPAKHLFVVYKHFLRESLKDPFML